jgi:hypothetical protein
MTLEEEGGHCWDRGVNKKEHMDHSCVISSLLPLNEVFYDP